MQYFFYSYAHCCKKEEKLSFSPFYFENDQFTYFFTQQKKKING